MTVMSSLSPELWVATKMTVIPSLPPELWVAIASHLSPFDLLPFRQISRLHRDVIKNYRDKLNVLPLVIDIRFEEELIMFINNETTDKLIGKDRHFPDTETLSDFLNTVFCGARLSELQIYYATSSGIQELRSFIELCDSLILSTTDLTVTDALSSIFSRHTPSSVDLEYSECACENEIVLPRMNVSDLKWFHFIFDSEVHQRYMSVDDAWLDSFRGNFLYLDVNYRTRITTQAINRLVKSIQSREIDADTVTLRIPFSFHRSSSGEQALDEILCGVPSRRLKPGTNEMCRNGTKYTIRVADPIPDRGFIFELGTNP